MQAFCLWSHRQRHRHRHTHTHTIAEMFWVKFVRFFFPRVKTGSRCKTGSNYGRVILLGLAFELYIWSLSKINRTITAERCVAVNANTVGRVCVCAFSAAGTSVAIGASVTIVGDVSFRTGRRGSRASAQTGRFIFVACMCVCVCV